MNIVDYTLYQLDPESGTRSGEYEIIVTVNTGMLWWKATHERVYRGSGTVWHNAKTGLRASTMNEAQLSAIVQKHKFEQEESVPRKRIY